MWPLLFPGIWGASKAKPLDLCLEMENPLSKLLIDCEGKESFWARMGKGPEEGDLCLSPNLGLMIMLPAPLPGRPDAHGAIGGSRLGWLVTDPQGATPSSFIGKDRNFQSALCLDISPFDTYIADQHGGKGCFTVAVKLLMSMGVIHVPCGCALRHQGFGA